jgi:hypothetical protein
LPLAAAQFPQRAGNGLPEASAGRLAPKQTPARPVAWTSNLEVSTPTRVGHGMLTLPAPETDPADRLSDVVEAGHVGWARIHYERALLRYRKSSHWAWLVCCAGPRNSSTAAFSDASLGNAGRHRRCTHCQRQSGSAFSANVGIPKGSLQYIGDLPATFEDLGASGLPVHRRFCNKCGSPIVSEAEATPTLDWLKSGTLDDRSWLQPQVSVWCDSAQPWVKLPDAMPKFPTSPPAA